MARKLLSVEGGCLCGAVRFKAGKPPQRGFYCHCRNCQKSYGGLFQATVQFSGDSFSFERGEPSYYRSSKFARRGFCNQCGSPLVFIYEGISDVWVLIGALDHPEAWPLTRDANWGAVAHYHTDSRIPWAEIADGLPQWTSATTPFLDEARARSKRPGSPEGKP